MEDIESGLETSS